MEERKLFRKSRPFGFSARINAKPDGSTDLTTWHCLIPGPKGTSWEGGLYPLTMVFPSDYPASPPTCAFPPGFIHPNVYPTGKVCLSLLSNDDDLGGQWAPSLTVTQVLVGIQELLASPNIYSPAQEHATELLRKEPAKYDKVVKEQAKKYPPADDAD